MRRYHTFGPILRAIAVISAVGIISTGVTFAALQSQNDVLTGNTIESATANLQISKDGTQYADTVSGFDFPGVIPGGSAVPAGGNAFYLKNTGSSVLKVNASISGTPTITGQIDLSKVSVVITRYNTSGTNTTQTFTAKALEDASTTGGLALTDQLFKGNTGQYAVQVAMASDAFVGASATISNLNLVFTGTAVTN